jgi:hypothetical protein
LFSSRTQFLNFLRDLKPTELVASAESELQNDRGEGKTLLYVLRTPDPLVSREAVYGNGDLSAEILPGGGLRIDTLSTETSWDNVRSCFQELGNYLQDSGKAATITTAEWKDRRPVTKSALVTLGTMSLKIGDIRGDIHCDLSGKN